MNAVLVDLRNHGSSPHFPEHDYHFIVQDLIELIDDHSLERIAVVGHSQGGKAALAFSLLHPDRCRAVVSLDASPAAYTHSHSQLFDAMNQLNLEAVHSIKDADHRLSVLIPDKVNRGFVLTNLQKVEGPHTSFRWRVNLPVLMEQEKNVHDWPLPRGLQFAGPTLFIGGTQSSRLTTTSYIANIPIHFPDHRVVFVDAGHFVHTAEPVTVSRHVSQFLCQLS